MKHYRKKPARPPNPPLGGPLSVGDDSAAGEEDPGAALDIDFAPPAPAPTDGGRSEAAATPVPPPQRGR